MDDNLEDVQCTRLSELWGPSWSTRTNTHNETPTIDYAYSPKIRLFSGAEIEALVGIVEENMPALLRTER
jgi:hypothetical protein